MRLPTKNPNDISSSLMDVITTIRGMVSFEIRSINFIAVPSTSIELIVDTKALKPVLGAIQIASTVNEIPSIQYNNTTSVKVTYACGAATSGKQSSTFLMVGK